MKLKGKHVIIVGSGKGKTTLAHAIAEVHGHELLSHGQPRKNTGHTYVVEVQTPQQLGVLLAAANLRGEAVCVVRIKSTGRQNGVEASIQHWAEQGHLREGVSLVTATIDAMESASLGELRGKLGLTAYFQKKGAEQGVRYTV